MKLQVTLRVIESYRAEPLIVVDFTSRLATFDDMAMYVTEAKLVAKAKARNNVTIYIDTVLLDGEKALSAGTQMILSRGTWETGKITWKDEYDS